MKNIITILLVVFATSNLFGTVLTVTNTNDNGAGSLRATINLASPNDTIRFTNTIATSSSDTILLDSTINIYKPLTIVGKRNGAIELVISGQNNYRVFNINSLGNFHIDSIAIIQGKETVLATGGGINYSGDTLKLNFVRFYQNEARIGGAIFATNVEVKNGNFLDNLGVIRGAAISTSDYCKIKNTYFILNKGGFPSREGIVIYSSGNLELIDSYVRNSTITGSYPQSAIFNQGNTSTSINNYTIIKNCEIKNNVGKGVKCSSTEILIDSCDIFNNSLGGFESTGSFSKKQPVLITNNKIYNNTGVNGVEISGASFLSIVNNKINNNGTGIKVFADNVYINNCEFKNNIKSSISTGGGIEGGALDSIRIFNTVIDSNKSFNGGAGANIGGNYIKFQNCRIQGNIANDGAIGAMNFEGGSGVYISGGENIYFNHCLFNGNSINPNGARTFYGGVLAIRTGSDSVSSIVNVDNCTFNKNESSYSSAISVSNYSYSTTSVKAHSILNINHSTFVNNKTINGTGYLIDIFARSNGGDDKSELNISNSTIYQNSINNKLLYASSTTSGVGKIRLSSNIIVNIDSNNMQTDSVISNGYNIFSDSLISNGHSTDIFNIDSTALLLNTLSYNGGLTPTLLPMTGSIAINNGNPSDFSDAQNGPVIDSRRDVGACELGAGVGIKESTQSINEVKLYPNPTTNNFQLQFEIFYENTIITVFDISGNLVIKPVMTKENNQTIHTQDLKSGIYLIVIKTENSIITKRLVKQ